MALFSDIDWIILLGVAAFFLLGREGGASVRMLGRWYGRAMRIKQELVSEVARAADLPLAAGTAPGSLRAVLLGADALGAGRSGIPAAVSVPPLAPAPPSPSYPLPWTGGYPVPSWSSTCHEVTALAGDLR